jgi:FlaA1/EpsC-like NDP-sugar epimerase
MIHLSGLTVRDEYNPDGDIEIKITGLRPGEKLYEELLIGDNVAGTQHPRIMRAEEAYISYEKLEEILLFLRQYIDSHDIESIIKVFVDNISGYSPKAEIQDHLRSIKNNDIIKQDYDNNNVIELSKKPTE